MPVINRNKCEGKGDCIEVCPKNVLNWLFCKNLKGKICH
ncbi:hypothetical protein [Acinetobacter bereziniae]